MIPGNAVRYRLVHVSDSSIIQKVEGRAYNKVVWKGNKDTVQYELDDDTVLQHRTIFFLATVISGAVQVAITVCLLLATVYQTHLSIIQNARLVEQLRMQEDNTSFEECSSRKQSMGLFAVQ